MRMDRYPHFLLALALVVLADAATAQTSYRFAVADAGTGTRLTPSALRIMVNDDEPNVATFGQIAAVMFKPAVREVRLGVNAGQEYGTRQISIKGPGVKTRSVNEFAVERRPSSFTIQFLWGGVGRLDRGEIDKGLALFELAFHQDEQRKGNPPLDDYEAILRYNYGRSLQQACLRLSYDTCGDARRHLEAILKDMGSASGARLYASHKVQRPMVETALADLNVRDVQVGYRVALDKIEAGIYTEAQAALGELIQGFGANPKAYRASSLSLQRLQDDSAYVTMLANQSKE